MENNITHHPSNKENCPNCMDLWIERENKYQATQIKGVTVMQSSHKSI